MDSLIDTALKIKHKIRFMILSFFILSLFSGGIMLLYGTIAGSPDLFFHVQRIAGLVDAFKNHDFIPQLNFYTMNQNGSAVFILYPYITLIPIVLFFSIFKLTITTFYMCFILLLFVGFIVSFYSCRTYTNDEFLSYIFAVLYGTSNTIVNSMMGSGDIGAFISILLLPVALFGFMKFLKDGSWKQLFLGMTLLIFTHVLTTIIVCLFMAIWLLINFKMINKNKIINLFKAIIITAMVTSIFTFPAINFLLNNEINKPFQFSMNGNDIFTIFLSPFVNSNTSIVISISSVIVILILIWSIIHKKLTELDHIDMEAVYLSFGFLFLSTNFIIPWGAINIDSIKLLQFPYRLDVIPQFLLVFIMAKFLTSYINYNKLNKKFHFSNSKKLKYSTIAIIVSLSIFLQFMSQLHYVYLAKSYHPLTENYINKDINYGDGFSNSENQNSYQINNNTQFKHLVKSPFSVPQTPDYYPKVSFPFSKDLSQNNGIYSVTHRLKFKTLGNGEYEFQTNEMIQELNLPVVKYNGFDYSVYLNNSFSPSHRNMTGLLTINNVKPGKYIMDVNYNTTVPLKFGVLFTFVGIIIFIILVKLKDDKKVIKNKGVI